MADIDTSTPHETVQTPSDDDISEPQAVPTSKQHWDPQYPTLAWSTSTDQLPNSGPNNMKQISLVKHNWPHKARTSSGSVR
ncbi:hypothetical protein SARC_12376 [Sphaeroforma arctica JP610]|uniref:Uncharacterized protein n=1 Tax=Sphaeroforma arctica JP610 TaxID=667725 RepID=A0A0L0FGE6_9EUKA|nr:hypothetical protein SARC_12376 [Sphaeroforma arctica JP610]KNC75093.1 hypothetical protein SARC_12376 [Sphaeroforma arctica JP610]|eukprot:XP_014148995.1 hypothetical protein SARC_12376 [Sphaeroforma arctica JP610]